MMRDTFAMAPVGCRGVIMRLLALLPALAMTAVLCPMGSIPAHAATIPGIIRVATYTDSSGTHNDGVYLGGVITDHSKVRTITFQKDTPSTGTCWNAGLTTDMSGGLVPPGRPGSQARRLQAHRTRLRPLETRPDPPAPDHELVDPHDRPVVL